MQRTFHRICGEAPVFVHIPEGLCRERARGHNRTYPNTSPKEMTAIEPNQKLCNPKNLGQTDGSRAGMLPPRNRSQPKLLLRQRSRVVAIHFAIQSKSKETKVKRRLGSETPECGSQTASFACSLANQKFKARP